MIISSVIAVMLITALAVLAFLLYMKKQAEMIPAMSADECIRYTLGGNEDGRLSLSSGTVE